MNFGNIGFTEILLIAVVVLLLFGAKRLPEIGAAMGKSITSFKRGLSDVDKSVREPVQAGHRLLGEQFLQFVSGHDALVTGDR